MSLYVYTVVFAINFALRVCARMYSIPVCIGINTRIMIRAYIVFYSALIFVCNAYSYDTRIHMIRVFVRYAYSYDTRIPMIRVFDWYAYRMLRYTRAILYFLKNEYSEDKFNVHIQCSEPKKWHFRASNFKNFTGGHAPGPPSYARSLNMLRSDFWLDPHGSI